VDWWHAIVLGVVQGLTEFLPVSSSGHLAVGQMLLQALGSPLPDPDAPSMIAFDLVVHVATLASIVAVLRRELATFVVQLLRLARPAWRFALLGGLATVVTFAVAYPFKDVIEAQFNSRLVIAACWVVTGIVLMLSDRAGRGRRGLGQFAWWIAVLIGLAQAAAVMPGISRSGATIAAAVLLGLRRRWAIWFSLLLAFPAIGGGAALHFRELLAGPAAQTEQLAAMWPMLAIGGAAAAIVGYLALQMLVAAARRARLGWFSYYVWALAIAVTVWWLAAPAAKAGAG